MPAENIEDRVTAIVKESLGMDQSPKTGDSLVADLGCDSLDLLELVMCIEDEFSVEITDANAEKCATVADVIELVHKATA